uniref:Rab3 GTPase-activating protein catalytic subunit n=1 Tax=Varanus komodoensis TaxID=61221 RepID=A0A8D2IZM2_VARKO
MAADSEPESEVFEITDFTTASEWERFISRVEEVLNDWKLIGPSTGKPLEKVKTSTSEILRGQCKHKNRNLLTIWKKRQGESEDEYLLLNKETIQLDC